MTDRTPLHIVQRGVTGQYYRDNILLPCVILFATRVGCHFVVQDDNVRAQHVQIINADLQQHNIY